MEDKSWLQKKFDRLPPERQERIKRILDEYATETVFLNDGEERDWSHLNCPTCGGSGHVEDVPPNVQLEPTPERAARREPKSAAFGRSARSVC